MNYWKASIFAGVLLLCVCVWDLMTQHNQLLNFGILYSRHLSTHHRYLLRIKWRYFLAFCIIMVYQYIMMTWCSRPVKVAEWHKSKLDKTMSKTKFCLLPQYELAYISECDFVTRPSALSSTECLQPPPPSTFVLLFGVTLHRCDNGRLWSVFSDSGQVKLHPSLFLLLLVLSRLYPSPMDGSSSPLGLAPFLPFIMRWVSVNMNASSLWTLHHLYSVL